MQIKLLAETVRTLTEKVPPEKEGFFYDTVLPRFLLRVRPPAAPGEAWPSTYLIRYTTPGGHQRKHTIGSPATMELDEARKAAKAKLAIVDQGGDPAADKAAAREQWSIKQAVDAYLASTEHRQKTAKVQQGETSALRHHIVYRLEHTPLTQIDVPSVRRLIREIGNDTRINARKRPLGGPGASRKVTRILSALLSWCVNEGRLGRNPLIGALRLDGDNERNVVISEAAEYAALFSAMDELVASGEMRAASRVFLTVAALTGMRRGELQDLHWGNIDLANRQITLRESKGIRLARRRGKSKPPEVISLPPYAAAVLAAHRPEDAADDDPVFVPRRGTTYAINRDWLKVRAKAGLPHDLALHGLRHSVGTVSILAGLSTAETQKLLRHSNVTTTSRYIHLASKLRLQDRAMAGMAPPLKESKRATGT